MKRGLQALLVIGGLALLGGAVRWCDDSVPEASILVDERQLMGTDWSIQIVVSAGGSRGRVSRAANHAYAELSRIESVMSEWREDTPISRLNRAAGSTSIEVPEELAAIIRRSVEYGELTHGAFDITWRGMGALWRFNDDFKPPSPEEVRRALAHVDYRRVRIEGNRVTLPGGFALGLGGIAKGYAIDRAGSVLRDDGFDDFLINGGGDVLAAGTKGGIPWSVGIRDPRGAPGTLLGRLNIKDGAVVTSGDYERFQIVDGQRYHHIIDPRTGWPADGCRSTTVLAPRAELADVLATALFVLGPEAGLELADSEPGVEALIIDASGAVQMTDGFRSLYQPLPVQ